MIGSLMPNAIEKLAAIELNSFVESIINSEQAIDMAIIKLKKDNFKVARGGVYNY